MIRDNYYTLLELDPAEDDLERILAVIRAKQNEWSMQRNHPRDAKRFQLLLGKLDDMRRVLKDPQLRRQEADEARRLAESARVEALSELDDRLRLAAAKGWLWQDEVGGHARRSRPALTEREVRDRILERKIEIRARPETAAAPRPLLEPTLERTIRDALHLVERRDLYEFLGMPSSAATSVLLNRAQETYSEIRATAVKDALTGARQDLAGHCLMLFRSEERRARYDNSLGSLRLHRIRKLAEAAGEGEKCISAELTQELIKIGRADGLQPDEVRAAVVETATAHRWPVEVPPKPTSAVLRRCGNCGGLAERLIPNCPKCALPFESSCPNCGTSNTSETRFCAKKDCGFEVGSMALAMRPLRDGKAALAAGDVSGTRKALTTAEAFWPRHPEAVRLRADLDRRIKAERQAIQGVEQAAAQGFDAFVQAVTRLRGSHPQCSKLAEFEALVTAAGAAAATEFSAAASDGRLRLFWKPTGRGDKLLLGRGESADAGSAAEPIALAPDATSYDDDTVSPGKRYWYFLWRVERSLKSFRPVRVGPLIAVAEVGDLKARPEDGRITLNWTRPAAAASLVVRRAEGEPPAEGSGVLLPAPNSAGLIDSGLRNNTEYGYRVSCVYIVDGEEAVTPGRTIRAVPCSPPRRVTDLRIAALDGVTLTWSNPAQESVVVVRSNVRPTVPVGKPIDAASGDPAERRLTEVDRNGGRDPAASAHEPYYSVYTLGRFAAVYCGSLQFVDIPSLEVRCGTDSVRVEWTWPAGCSEVGISRRSADSAPAAEPAETVVRRDGEAAGGSHTFCAGDLPDNAVVHVRCRIPAADPTRAAGRGVSAAVRVVGRQAVRWDLRRPGWWARWWLGRKPELIVRVTGRWSTIRRLRLMARAGRHPEAAADPAYRCLAEWRPGPDADADAPAELILPLAARPAGWKYVHCRLFVEPDERMEMIPPGPENGAIL